MRVTQLATSGTAQAPSPAGMEYHSPQFLIYWLNSGISELKWRLVTPAEHSQSVFSVMDRSSLLSAGNTCFRVPLPPHEKHFDYAFAAQFLHKAQESRTTWQKVTGITANPDAHPENEGSTEALSRQLEVTREAGLHPACLHGTQGAWTGSHFLLIGLIKPWGQEGLASLVSEFWVAYSTLLSTVLLP